jgi:hypothetical protein
MSFRDSSHKLTSQVLTLSPQPPVEGELLGQLADLASDLGQLGGVVAVV